MKRVLISFALLGYISLALFGVFAMGQVHHHAMGTGDNCPFLLGEQAICTMSLTDHVSAWQSLFVSTIELMVTLTVVGCCVLFYFFLRTQNVSPPRWYTKPAYEQFMTTLFSNGILHSKAF